MNVIAKKLSEAARLAIDRSVTNESVTDFSERINKWKVVPVKVRMPPIMVMTTTSSIKEKPNRFPPVPSPRLRGETSACARDANGG